MPALLAGVVVLGLLVLMGRGYTAADVKKLARNTRFTSGILLALLTVVFIVTDRFAFALLTAGGAWVLLFRTVPPWHRPDFGAGSGAQGSGRGQGGSSPPAPVSAMSRSEALSVLGLKEGAGADDIRAAHRRLIQQIHPDKGGTNYLAAKINQAKDVLLGK